MRSRLEKLTIKAQEYSRNPLGIIALFIVLVYGIAGLVLGISGANMQPSERLPLIWFLVVFPVIVLAAFYRLVTRHHVKLYAPQDFLDKDDFFRALSPNEQKKKLDEEVRDVESELHRENDQILHSEKEALISSRLMTRTNIILAEDLALREIENEFAGPIYRQTVVAQQFPVDGVLTWKGKRIIVEVKYVRRSLIPLRGSLDRMSKKVESYLRSVSFPPTSFILAIVADNLPEDRRISETEILEKLLRSLNMPIQLRIYDFGTLKEKYGIQQEDTTG